MSKNFLKKYFLLFLILFFYFFSGCSNIWNNILQEPKNVLAETNDLLISSCDIDDLSNPTCYNALSSDAGTSISLVKGEHVDAPFQTLSAESINSATLYYDSWGALSGTWGIYIKDSRDGNTICSIDPAPEDSSETNNSTDCSSLTTTQLSNGIWLQINNDDDKGPELIYLDYVYLSLDYNPAPIVSVSVSDGNVNYGILTTDTNQDTTASGLNNSQTATNNGNVNENFLIRGQDSANWILSGSVGSEQYTHKFCTSNCDSSPVWVALTTTDQTLATGISPSSNQIFDLQITTPNETSNYTQQSVDVIITAIEQ
jgi:hypothetical protein